MLIRWWRQFLVLNSVSRQSLSQQISRRLLLLSAIAMAGLIIAMTLGLTTSVERIKRKLDRASAQAAGTFDLFLLNAQSDLIATSASLATTPKPREVLRSMLSRNHSLVDIWLVDLNGKVLVQQSRVGRPKATFLASHPLLQKPGNINQVLLGEVQFEDRSPYIEMAVTVTDEIELPIAILLVRIDLTELWSKTIEIQIGAGGYAYITDDKGQIVAFRNRRFQEKGKVLPELIGRSPLDIARSGFNLYWGLGDRWVVASAQRLEVLPWFAVVEQPAREFLPPLLLVISLWLGVLVIAVITVYRMHRFTRTRIVIPLMDLQKVVARLSSGEWDYRFEVNNQDELGELATSFQEMARQLQESFRALEINNTQMKELNEALLQSESKLTQFLEAVPVGVFVVNAQGKPYYANQKAQQLLGRGLVPSANADNLEEIYQIYVAGSNRLYPHDRQPILRALRGENAMTDDLEIHQGDRTIPVEIWGTPIFDGEGQVIYAIVAIQDITERKKAEIERLHFTEELAQLNLAYERFVPEQFLNLLNKKSIIDVELGDAVQREMSILFADIRDFTTVSERMTPEDNFKFINAYLSRMEPAIIENQGFIDKYIGDEIMALFSGGADDAVKAGISMLKRLNEYNTTRQRPDRLPIRIGIGINTGTLMLGTVGGRNHRDSTVISDAVNLASRLERLTKTYGVSLLISHQTFLRLSHRDNLAVRLIDRVAVKGKSQKISVFEVFEADPPEVREKKLTTKTIFEQAFLAYYSGHLAEAEKFFKECLKINPLDQVVEIYLKRCQGE